MNEEEKYNLIEQYLAKELEAKDLKDFEALLAKDEVLKEEVKLHQEISNSLKGEKIHQFRAALKTENQKWTKAPKRQETKTRRLNLRKWGAFAATFALLLVSYLLLFPTKPSSEQLFAQNFELYPMVLNQRSGTDIDSLLNAAITSYEKRDFKKAIQQFQTLQINQPTNLVYSFYEGLSLLGNQQNKQAAIILKKIGNTNDSKFKEQSQWYLALAYLQANQHPEAIVQLKKIQQGQYQYTKAVELLKNL